MQSESETYVTVDLEVPASLLAEMDAYAAVRGYESPDGVVREALDGLE